MAAVRTLSVSCLHRDQGYLVPFIRLAGLWLQEIGFNPGDRIRVEVKFGQLVITKLTPSGEAMEPRANPSEFGFMRELDESARKSGGK